MNTVGLPISHKENEKRRTLVPQDIQFINNPKQIFIEEGYGEILGFSDEEYRRQGVNIASRQEVLTKNYIADPKIGDAEYLDQLDNQTIFGWVHAVQNRDITDKIINHHLSSFAWEDMYENGRHSFWRNNEIAGEAAVFHAYMCHGIFPYNTRAAVLGRGNIARGAVKTLNFMGAEVIQYDRKTEALFREELTQFDVIVNAILWDTSRKDHIIYREDLKRMRHNSMIIDVSCDRCGGVETSIPTTIENPTYKIDGVTHYVVDHTPSLFWKTTTETLSKEFVKYVDFFIEGHPLDSKVLRDCHNFERGVILDPRIIAFQGR
ncbi:MAG: N(5)-(carboxyethyl)ornithine synthase [Bacteroidales bacterium]|nr:N(5)-(carboxyethyl)ornithine synthase [Candidatus Colimorpha merdihippi]